jgi:hypothetical protein
MSLDIMDYSLLVGIHSPSSDAARALTPDPASPSDPARPFSIDRRSASIDMARRHAGGHVGGQSMSVEGRGGSLDSTRRTASTGQEEPDVDTAAFNPGAAGGLEPS